MRLIKLNKIKKINPSYKKDDYVSRKAASRMLGVKASTLAVWASSKRYKLPYYKLGSRKVLYKIRDILDFIESGRH